MHSHCCSRATAGAKPPRAITIVMGLALPLASAHRGVARPMTVVMALSGLAPVTEAWNAPASISAS